MGSRRSCTAEFSGIEDCKCFLGNHFVLHDSPNKPFSSLSISKTCFFSWGQLKDLPKLGALAIVKDGDNVLTSLGLGVHQDYPSLMMKLVYLSGIYLSSAGLVLNSLMQHLLIQLINN